MTFIGRGRAHREEILLVSPVLIAKISHQPGLQQEAGGSLKWETEEFYEGTAYRKGQGWLSCQGVVTQPGSSTGGQGLPKGQGKGSQNKGESGCREMPSQTLPPQVGAPASWWSGTERARESEPHSLSPQAVLPPDLAEPRRK